MDRVGQVLVETYRVERLIAEGGMASVYEAHHLRVPKRFAVKFLKLQWVTNPEALLRFRREAELIATFEHSGIVQLVDYNVAEDGAPYIVLEYLDGESLGARIDRGRLDLSEAIGVARVVASALASAHARGVIHRDLKPENIILIKDGVKVVDFGVAKLRGGADLTAFNTILGTVCYMAPEQITGGAVDARADQFSLAEIVREMLTGEHFVDATKPVAEQAMRILHKEPPPVAGVPSRVNAALSRALSKDPKARFATITEFIDALSAGADSTLEMAPVELPPEEEAGLPPLPDEETTITPPPHMDVAPLPSHARVTLKPMMCPEGFGVAPPPPTGLRATPRQPRWVWIAVGAAAAGGFATVLIWLVLR